MTQLLPVALRGLLPENVRLAIVKLCAFLNAISQKVIFGKGPGGQPIPKDADRRAPMWKKKSIGPALLERPRGPLRNRRDARDEESLCDPAWLIGPVWEDKRYT